MAAVDYAAGPDIRWYLSVADDLNSIPADLSIAELVGNGKIVDDLDDDDSSNLLKDAIGDATLGISSETASWRPYGRARGRRKATGGEIEDFTLENVLSMKDVTLNKLAKATKPLKCLICGLAISKQASDDAIVAADEATFFLIQGDINPLPISFSNTDVMKATLTVAVTDYKIYDAAA